MAGKIFINYRRHDDPGAVRALFAQLKDAFAPEQLFLDVKNIPLGEDFVEFLETQVAQHDVLLAVIGKKWLDIRDADGARRLNNPKDSVRIEIEAALRLGKRIIPVLVNNAEMPKSDDLPESLKPLTGRHAIQLTHQRFEADVQELIEGVVGFLGGIDMPRIREKQAVPNILPEKIIKENLNFMTKTLDAHTESVRSVVFSPDGRMLASGSDDTTVKLWDVGSGRLIQSIDAHDNSVLTVAFSPNGHTLASGSRDSTVRLWNVSSGQIIQSIKAHSYWVTSVTFSSDGSKLASGSRDRRVKLWDVSSKQIIEVIIIDKVYFVNSIAFSPNGHILASGSDDNAIKLWDADSGRLIQKFDAHMGHVRSVAFSPDGRILASGSADNTVKFWDVGSGRIIRSIDAHASCINSVAFSPDGRALASGSDDYMIKLWNIGSGELIQSINAHAGHVESVVFSPDGRMLAMGSSDRKVKVWSIRL